MSDAQWPSPRELFMMNGGNKLYIYKDGFGDIYHATADEEKEWTKEIMANELKKVDAEENPTGLKFAIETLLFHDYPYLKQLLLQRIQDTSVTRQIVLATALWKWYKYEESFRIIHQLFLMHTNDCMDDVFWGLNEFKDNIEAAHFLIDCLEGTNETLFSKAHTTIIMWAYTGLPELRNNNLMARISPVSKHSKQFKPAMDELKKLLLTIK